MEGDFTPTLYIRLRKRIQLPRGKPIRLGQVAQLIIEPEWEERLRSLVLHSPQAQDGNFVLVDMMLVIRKVKEVLPRVTVEHFGDPHVIVELGEERVRPAGFVLIALVWLLLFIGSGLAIMNFHADVSMLDVHQKLFTLVTGKKDMHPLIMQIPYSFGIAAGMIIFFNRLFRKKFNEEPNPLEVELYMYQESVHQYVITDEYTKQQERGRE